MLKGLVILGNIITAATPATQMASAQHVQNKFNFDKRYEISYPGFKKLMHDIDENFNFLNIKFDNLRNDYENNLAKIEIFMNKFNFELTKRGFWSWLGHAFATVGTAIGTGVMEVVDGVTGHAIDKLHSATQTMEKTVVSEWDKSVEAGGVDALQDLLEVGASVGHLAAGVAGVATGNPDIAAENFASAVDTFAGTTKK